MPALRTQNSELRTQNSEFKTDWRPIAPPDNAKKLLRMGLYSGRALIPAGHV